uniref:G protein-coupled receptor 132a n=1 Tax=Myripristis murdjan TaxID=586833 RepID=A0A667X3E0_9TELE
MILCWLTDHAAVFPAGIMHETLTQSPLGTNNSSSSPSCDLPYDEDRLPLVLLYSVVLAIGLPANLLTIYLTWLQVRRKNVLGIYLWSLSLCDLMYLCTLPMWAYYVNQNHMWPWSGLACKVTGYIFFNNMYISIFLLCCISCDRYVAVVYAVESRGLRRQRLAIIVAAAIVLVVALGHMPVFIMQEGNASDGRCFEPGHSNTVVTGFNYARFVIGFLIPLALLVITNRVILANIQLSSGLRPQQKERVRPSSCDFEKKIYTPYTISLGLSTFNSAINPILYVLSSDNIQKELVRGLAALHSRATVRPRSTDSSQHKMQHSKNSDICKTGLFLCADI